MAKFDRDHMTRVASEFGSARDDMKQLMIRASLQEAAKEILVASGGEKVPAFPGSDSPSAFAIAAEAFAAVDIARAKLIAAFGSIGVRPS